MQYTRIRFILAAALTAGFAVHAGAESPVGTWQTPPDANGIFAHIVATPCGAGTCGVIARTYDREGRQVTTPNLGRRVFWDMRPVGGGRWEGQAYVPLYKRTVPGVMQISGNRARVSGCAGPVCLAQSWRRVR